MDSNLTQQLTRSLASEDFDAVVAQLPAFQAEVERRLEGTPDPAARAAIADEALSMNRRWLSLAKSLQSNMHQQLQSLTVQSGYADDSEAGHVFETMG